MEKLRKFIDRTLSLASDRAKEKSVVYQIFQKEFLVNYLWREKNTPPIEIKAILFRVGNGSKEHNVLLAIKDAKWYIWCGDAFCERKGYKEDPCYQKKGRNQCCHHMVAALNMMNVLEAEDFLIGKPASRKGLDVNDEIQLAFELNLPLLLYGVTGAGKSYRVFNFFKEKKLKNFVINMSTGLEDIDLLAKMIPNPKGKWNIQDGELWVAFKEAQKQPIAILLEELTRSSKSVRNLLLKAMDPVTSNYVLQNFVTGSTIAVPTQNIWWVATANLGYSDTEELDPALMRRFLVTSWVNYSQEVEMEILKSLLPEKLADDVYKKIVQPIRKAYQLSQIPYPIDTGTLKVFATLIANTNDIKRSAEMSFIYRLVDVDATGTPSEEQLDLLYAIVEEVEL